MRDTSSLLTSWKCDFLSPCSKCEGVKDTALIFKQPCVRVSLKEVLPFRAGNSRIGAVRSKLPTFSWSPDHPEMKAGVIRHLLDGVGGDDYAPELRVICRLFVAGPADVLSETYEAPGGKTVVVQFPPYACVRGPMSFL
jgi:hypothetical protein